MTKKTYLKTIYKMGYAIFLGCVTGAILSVYLLINYINKKMSEREAATKEPEYISPEKEYISDEQINEIRGTIIEIPGKLSAAQISRTKEALTNFASDGITAKQFLENARIFASGGITAKDAMQNFTENLSRANLVSIREINDGLYIRLFGVGKGKTIADAAELVGNYGQPMTFNSPIYTTEQTQKEPDLAAYAPTPEMVKEMREIIDSAPLHSIKRVKK